MTKNNQLKEIQKRLPENITVTDSTNFDFTDDEFLGILSWLKYFNNHYELNGKKVFNKLRFSLYIGIIITLVLFVIGYFAYVPVGVMSNSMSPIYKRGDMLIYKKDKDIENIKVGDIVCYSYEDKLIMHRVIKISNNNVIKLTMKGDNVNSEDAIKVTKDNMIGKIVLIIPKLGYPSVWLYDLLS